MEENRGLRRAYRHAHILEQIKPQNPLYWQYAKESEQLQLQLEAALPPELRALFDAYVDAMVKQSDLFYEELFVFSFSYGLKTTHDIQSALRRLWTDRDAAEEDETKKTETH